MNEAMTDGNSSNAGIDLSQFYQVFFEEAGENLDRMEQQLLEIDIESANDEELNLIFRCAHSVKGGAATFGFNDVAELTHQMETLLDKLRRHEIAPSTPMVDVLLQAGDILRSMLARHQGSEGDVADPTELLASIRALSNGKPMQKLSTPAVKPPSTAPTTQLVQTQAPVEPVAPAIDEVSSEAFTDALPDGSRILELRVGPLVDPGQADNLVDLFKEIVNLGTIEMLDGGQHQNGMRFFKVTTTSPDNELIDLFSFHVSREQVQLIQLNREDTVTAPSIKTDGELQQPYGFFSDSPGAPSEASLNPTAALIGQETAIAGKNKSSAKGEKGGSNAAALESSTLRVSVEKVDQLINLVGELVITQAMLAQNSKHIDPGLFQQMVAGLADLERNTRDLQESVMSIRMIPMATVFNRFPRMLRDLAAKLQKKVEFVTKGESTELDKGLVEKITDPLTHLVRNSCDHGIESPEERVAKGKSEFGTITLAASHQGGSILIEVRDDGRGLSREKLLKKARERGIDAPDSMPDGDVWSLIFAPGFSTADVVTDISGRGVGMDVVKKNITALGGSVEIDSAEGYGMRVSVRLPLTLAIMDGMSVAVGEEVYILPLSSVVESFQVQQDLIKTIGNEGRVVEVREEYMPVLELERVFNVPRFNFENVSGIMVVVEAEGGRVALLVDELLGQQQVVVKNLEANYRKVNDVSGATIMGDGRVALILDIGSLVRRSRH
jgi:two-component system, chemotaxis family, sensor kinase CheA